MDINVGWLMKDGSIKIRREYGETLPLHEQLQLCEEWIESLKDEKRELWAEIEYMAIATDGTLND